MKNSIDFAFFKNFEKAHTIALEEIGNELVNRIKVITPRDPERLPKDPSRSVTGTLKRSVKKEVNTK